MYHQHQEHRQIQQPQHQQQQQQQPPHQPQQPQHRQDNNGYNNHNSNINSNSNVPSNSNHDVVVEDHDASAAAAAMGSAASNLDHALLESLFYNEMSSFEPSSAMGHHHTVLSAPTEHDTPHTIVEKEILRDFGVGQEFVGKALFESPPPEASSSTPATDNTHYSNVASLHQQQQQPYHHQQQEQQQEQSNHPLHHQQVQSSSRIQPQYASNSASATYNTIPTSGMSNNSAPPATARQDSQGQGQAPNQMGMVYMDTQATATAAAAAAAMLSNNGGIKLQSNAGIPVPAVTAASTARPPSNASSPYSNTIPHIRTEAVASNSGPSVISGVLTQQQRNQQQQTQTQTATNKGSDKSTAASTGLRVQVTMENGARKLVDQFATLASRLGIDLPDSVLQSLTSAAAKNDPTLLMNNEAQTNKVISTAAATLATTIHATTTKTKPSLNSGKIDGNGTSNDECNALDVASRNTLLSIRSGTIGIILTAL